MHKDAQQWARAVSTILSAATQQGIYVRAYHTRCSIPVHSRIHCWPLPVSSDCSYILTIIDSFAHFPSAKTIHSITAAKVAKSRAEHRISCSGVPATILADWCTQLKSIVFNEIIAAYHLQANGMVKQVYHNMKM